MRHDPVPLPASSQMTLTQLRYLVAIIDHGFNVSRAAEALHTSQPGVSRQIRLLEQQLGSTVLARQQGRIVGVTDSGLKAVSVARRILKDVGSLQSMGEDILQQDEGRLTIGTLHTFALSMLPHALSRLRAKYRRVVIDVRQASPQSTFEQVAAGELDVGVTITPPNPGSRLLALPVNEVKLVLVVPAGHELIECPPRTLAELQGYPMIRLSPSASAWGVDNAYKASGLALNPAIHVPDASLMISYVAAGAGVAFVPALISMGAGVHAIEVDHLVPPIQVIVTLDPSRFHRRYVYDFIELIAPRWSKSRVDRAMCDAVFAAS